MTLELPFTSRDGLQPGRIFRGDFTLKGDGNSSSSAASQLRQGILHDNFPGFDDRNRVAESVDFLESVAGKKYRCASSGVLLDKLGEDVLD